MRIAVNTRLLLKDRLDGIGWYKYHTLKRITKSHMEHEFYFIFDRPFNREFIFSNNITPVVLAPPARHPLLWYLWFEFSLPRLLRKIKPDLFLSPDGYLPLSSHVPSVAVIHDINFFHRPEDIPYITRYYYQKFFPQFARKADRIATVSEYSRNDISQSYGVPLEKIDVTYNGSHEIYQPLDELSKTKIRQKYCNGNPYFIFIGSLHPRKNLERLLQAFDSFKIKTGSQSRLMIVGSRFFNTGAMHRTLKAMRFSEEVIFTGRLEPEELKNVLGSAIALTYVPLFEGFGIPLVEAMYCNVPLIASNVTSLPEVAGDAAIYADPYNAESISYCMQKIESDALLRNELIKKGRIQRQKFSWDITANRLWECMMKAKGISII